MIVLKPLTLQNVGQPIWLKYRRNHYKSFTVNRLPVTTQYHALYKVLPEVRMVEMYPHIL